MIFPLPNDEHIALYVHSGKVWFVSSKGVPQPLPYEIAKQVGAEMHSLARAELKRQKA